MDTPQQSNQPRPGSGHPEPVFEELDFAARNGCAAADGQQPQPRSIVEGLEIVDDENAGPDEAQPGVGTTSGRISEHEILQDSDRVVILDRAHADPAQIDAGVEEVRDSLDPERIVSGLLQAFRRVARQIVGREELLHQSLYAVLTREHQLIYSRAGMAKSLYATAVFGQFKDAHTFSMQLTKGTPEEGLVGAIVVEELKKGNIVHNVSGSIVEARLAFLDEIFDANDVALRSLLGILNERLFRKGKQHVEAVMHSAIATSNYVRSNDVTEAVIDRFAFRALLLPSDDPYEMLRIDRAYGDKVGRLELPPQEQRVPISHLEYLADIVEGRVPEQRIGCPAHVLFLKNAVIQEYLTLINAERRKSDEPEIYISPRTMAKARDVLNASALLHGRREVQIDDLSELRYMITVVGDPKQEAAFAQALKQVTQRYSARDFKTVDFLIGAHDLLEEMLAAVEEGRKIKLSLLQRLQLFFGMTSYHDITFSNITRAVRAAAAEAPAVVALRDSLLARIEAQRERIEGSNSSALI